MAGQYADSRLSPEMEKEIGHARDAPVHHVVAGLATVVGVAVIKIVNWSSFQSYKDRKPPWVRLHKTLLDNYEFQSMSADARALLPMLWLIASEDEDPVSGLIRDSYEKICFRLRISIECFTAAIDECVRAGFIETSDAVETSDKTGRGVIYFMLARKSNLLKIGYTEQLDWRKKKLEYNAGEDLELIFTMPGTIRLENDYHELFKKFASEKSEWYHYVTESEDLCNDIITGKLRAGSRFVTPEKTEKTETERATRLERARDDSKSAFQKIYDAGSAVFPNLATANTSSIHQWIAAGCDPDLDAVPEIQRHAKAGKAVKAWSYFTGGIMDAKATRETPPPKGNPNGKPSHHHDRPTKDERARAAVMRGFEAAERALAAGRRGAQGAGD